MLDWWSLFSVSVLFPFLLIVQHLLLQPPPGWTSLAVLQLVLGGVFIMCIGAVGLCVGRIFEQVRGRPLYVVADTCGGDAAQAAEIKVIRKNR